MTYDKLFCMPIVPDNIPELVISAATIAVSLVQSTGNRVASTIISKNNQNVDYKPLPS